MVAQSIRQAGPFRVRVIARVLLALGVILSCPQLAVAASPWAPAADMTTARYLHTATRLPDGKTLIAGGFSNASGFLDGAELYDPAGNTWSDAMSMGTRRYLHTATLLPNGKVLVVGGGNDATPASLALASVEIYDPVDDSWVPAASLATARLLHSATLLPNGKVLVAGGQGNDGLITAAELYDPANNTWTEAGSMAALRQLCTATLLANGKVLIAGGTDLTDALASGELYNPASNTWSPAGNMAHGRQSHTATALANGKVLVAGGSDDANGGGGGVTLASAELYDPVANTWSSAASMAAARAQHTATLLANGNVLVAGSSGDGGFLASAELYDPVSDRWAPAGSMAAARYGNTATLLADGRVLIAGGSGNPAMDLASAELYSVLPTRVATFPGDFGDQVVDAQSSVVYLPVTNAGDEFLFVAGVALGGSDPDDFTVVDNRCTARVSPDNSCFIGVRFTPGKSGSRSATLTLTDNGQGGSQIIPLSGNGVPAESGPPGQTGPPGGDGSDGAPGATGATGAQGAAGAQGGAGTNGLNGAVGPAGPKGEQGAQGPAGVNGRDALVTCKPGKAKRGKVKVTCTVRFRAASSSTRVRARLARGHRVYASGARAVKPGARGSVSLRARRRLARGSYTLLLTFADARGHESVIRQRVSVR